MNWISRFLNTNNIDKELIEEKKTSTRSKRKFLYRWLKFSLGKQAFQDVKRIYSIGWTQEDFVSSFVKLLEDGLYEDLEKAFENYEKELNEPVNDKPSIFAIEAYEFFIYVMQDNRIYLKIINGAFTSRKIYSEKLLTNIQVQKLSKRKLIFPV